MAIYLVARSDKYLRPGDNVGDLYEIFEGPKPPGGTGYENADIIEIKGMTKEDIQPILLAVFALEKVKEYWKDQVSKKWYEIKVKPKYPLNIETLTNEDREVLADPVALGPQKMSILTKLKRNLERHPENLETLMPPE